jgi:hypothetical protein
MTRDQCSLDPVCVAGGHVEARDCGQINAACAEEESGYFPLSVREHARAVAIPLPFGRRCRSVGVGRLRGFGLDATMAGPRGVAQPG